MTKRPQGATKSTEIDQTERIIRARTAVRPVRRIAADEKMTEAAVNDVLDQWVRKLIGPELREREYALLLTRNDELIEALRPKALATTNRNMIREYSAALNRRATLLALRPPKDVNVRLMTDEVQRVTQFDRMESAVRAFIEQRPKTVNGG